MKPPPHAAPPPHVAPSPTVVVREASVVIGDVLALPATSFTAAPEAPAVIVGPNGSGKTTLLRLLAGLASATSGSVHVLGRRPDERRRACRRATAALIGAPPVADNLTLLEHLTLIGLSWGEDADRAGRRGLDLLDRFGMAGLARRFPQELSSGQSQILSLSIVLARPCEVLLLDEPEQRLDSDRVGTLADLLTEVQRGGVTVVMASHSPALTALLDWPVLDLRHS